MVGRTLRDTFWICYDHLGKLVVVSVLWALLTAGLVTFPLALVGVAHFGNLLARKGEASILDFFRGIRQYLWRGSLTAVVTIGLWAVLCANVYFYATVLMPKYRFLGSIIAGASIWLLLFYTLMMGYPLPLLIQRGHGVKNLLKYSALLVVDNLWFTVVITFSTLTFTAVMVWTKVGVVFLLGGTVAVLWSVAYRELEKKYSPELRAVDFDENANRGLRDILRPWEM